MEQSQSAGIGGLSQLHGQIELVDDNLTLNEEFKKNVAIPYFKDIFKDLVQWSDNKTKGINKVSILTVIIYYIAQIYMSFIIVYIITRNNRRKVLLCARFKQ